MTETTLDAWDETRAALQPGQRLVMWCNSTGVSYVQVLEPDSDEYDADMVPVITQMAYPEKPELSDSSWPDALRCVRDKLAARASRDAADRMEGAGGS